MEHLNVKPMDSRDSHGRDRFIPLPIADLVLATEPDWYDDHVYYPHDKVAQDSLFVVKCF